MTNAHKNFVSTSRQLKFYIEKKSYHVQNYNHFMIS